MIGYFDVQVKDLPPGIDDAVLRGLLTPGGKSTPELDRLLARMPTSQRARGRNLVSDNFAAFIFRFAFSGGDITDPYDFDSGNAILATILLMTTDSEPTYTDSTNQYTNLHNISGSANTGSAGKRFIEDDIDPHLQDADPDGNGRESILFRSRFLYLAAQGNSNDIRSLGIYFMRDADSTGNFERARTARIRLKDSGGNPIILNKTSSQVLLIEYRFTLVNI
jgi:hypothetical protein